MAKKVYVTAAQTDAARMVVRRSASTGKSVSPSVSKIANAQAHPATVTGKTADAEPASRRGRSIKSTARLALSGRFVTKDPTGRISQKSK